MHEPMDGSLGRRYAALLEEVRSALLRCRSAEEVCAALHDAFDRQLPSASACVYLADANGTHFTTPGTCECQRNAVPEFRHYECWAICRRTAHLTGPSRPDAPCGHAKASSDSVSHFLCLPLLTESRMLGLMHIQFAQEEPQANPFGETALKQVADVAGEVGAALARLRPA